MYSYLHSKNQNNASIIPGILPIKELSNLTGLENFVLHLLGIIHLLLTQSFTKKTIISYPLIGTRNDSFSKNFAYVLNEWSFEEFSET